MRRCNKQGDSDNEQECWSLRFLRHLQEHTALVGKIYEDVRPLGNCLVKITVVVSGFHAGLDVLEQAVPLLM